ncbi:hypothetical protein [Amycolatopsis sp. NPDC051102]|uniref:hypothetical protein n=1 Tax=Amycolatopsis sp. NPDC051102 TaxID=3155163 RepID=UPI0034279BB4
MTLLGVLEDDEYLPDHGVLVIRDRHVSDAAEPWGNELLGELATDALSGTIATAGDGWVHGRAGDPYQAVRLEAHDEPPPVVLAEWEDVVETPFHSRSGRLAFASLTGGEYEGTLDLGRRGLFRARVARRAAAAGEEGDVWLLQFWPCDGDPGLPRWVKRTRPAVDAPDPGWQLVLGYPVMEVAYFAAGYGPPRPESWLDEPLRGDPPDAAICAQLGVTPPQSPREAIELLVAAGVLVPDGTRHRPAERAPSAADRLDLPGRLATQVEQAAAHARYAWVAADLTLVAAWGHPAAVDDLAERLLIPAGDVPGLLAYAATRYVEPVDGGIVARPRRPLPSSSVPVAAVRRPVRAANPVTFAGAPPRAGVIGGNGDVVVWRLDGPVVLGHVPDQYRYRAYETRTGIAVATSSGPGVLVRWDGTVERLPVDLGTHPVRSADGRFLAGTELHVGRRSWDRPHLLDLVTGEVASLPPADELTRQVLGVHDGTVYYRQGFHAGSRAFRWRPGTDPEPLTADLQQVDPLSGATLATDGGQTIWRTPDGDRIAVPAGRRYELAPGGRQLYAFRYDPPSAWLLDAGAGEPQEQPLPEGCDTSTAIPAAPFWETPSTLVFHHERGGGTRLVRWHLRANDFDHFDLPALTGYRPFAIRPILRAPE